jgi:hypothetical protein
MKEIIRKILKEEFSGEKKNKLVVLFFKQLMNTEFEMEYEGFDSSSGYDLGVYNSFYLKPQMIWFNGEKVMTFHFEKYKKFPGREYPDELNENSTAALQNLIKDVASIASNFNIKIDQVRRIQIERDRSNTFVRQKLHHSKGIRFFMIKDDGTMGGDINFAAEIL